MRATLLMASLMLLAGCATARPLPSGIEKEVMSLSGRVQPSSSMGGMERWYYGDNNGRFVFSFRGPKTGNDILAIRDLMLRVDAMPEVLSYSVMFSGLSETKDAVALSFANDRGLYTKMKRLDIEYVTVWSTK